MSDLIDRQVAIDALDEQIEQCNKALSSFDISPKDEYAIKVERASLKAYKEQLENMPSAQPEIIRCKDCKYSSPNGKYGCKSYHYRLYETHEMKPDDFCSFAERRADERSN